MMLEITKKVEGRKCLRGEGEGEESINKHKKDWSNGGDFVGNKRWDNPLGLNHHLIHVWIKQLYEYLSLSLSIKIAV